MFIMGIRQNSMRLMTFSQLNKTFNIETMQLQEHEDDNTYVPAMFVKLTKQEQRQVVTSFPSGRGRGSAYPWNDPSYAVGDSFFKAVQYKDWEEGRGRPSVPQPHKAGRVWKTTKGYRKDTKQYGYEVMRIA